MSHTSLFRRAAAFSLLALSLSACTASLSDQSDFRAYAESYIRANINDISTRSPVAGGRFEVKDIEWIDDDTVRISFEDGHIALKGTVDVQMNDTNIVAVSRFRIENDKDDDADDDSDKDDDKDDDNDDNDEDDNDEDNEDEDEDQDDDDDRSSSSRSSNTSASSVASSATSLRAKAGLGEFCGGIAAFQCKDDLTCKLDGTYPDAGGVCVDDDD